MGADQPYIPIPVACLDLIAREYRQDVVIVLAYDRDHDKACVSTYPVQDVHEVIKALEARHREHEPLNDRWNQGESEPETDGGSI